MIKFILVLIKYIKNIYLQKWKPLFRRSSRTKLVSRFHNYQISIRNSSRKKCSIQPLIKPIHPTTGRFHHRSSHPWITSYYYTRSKCDQSQSSWFISNQFHFRILYHGKTVWIEQGSIERGAAVAGSPPTFVSPWREAASYYDSTRVDSGSRWIGGIYGALRVWTRASQATAKKRKRPRACDSAQHPRK